MPVRSDRLVVTGSSGFIGSHFCAASDAAPPTLGIDRFAPRNGLPRQSAALDLSCHDTLAAAAAGWRGADLVHLAADAEVVLPWDAIPGVFRSNLTGMWNVLDVIAPRLCLFASSSSVYGTATLSGTDPRSASLSPLGLYACSKAAGEVLLRDWAAATGSAAIAFRFGNVVGPRCRGLIPFLIEHALRHPEGAEPVRLRGEGRLVRDYTPVDFVVAVLLRALDFDWPPAAFEVFNIGTGSGLTNREVTEIVAAVLAAEGYRLRADFSSPVAAGESLSVVLDCASLARRFDLEPPAPAAVRRAIEDAARSHLRSARG
ncbi:MAG: NAD(P)-dependent oxidoreductase [Acidobacteriota bacterium]|nr:NAD(P)-dependent oxidoreductase [Acidobacteriota bacterium]